ncbi:major facilitator superfamily domain-containing protein [Cladochytrium replicatum]|nr:major facilitator superfamily domain-containing protein [Cladochytrium replicatum]
MSNELEKPIAVEDTPQMDDTTPINTIVQQESDKKDGGEGFDALLIEEACLSWSEDEERAIVRKMDVQIIPWISAMYLLSFLDRVNIGNAKVVNSNTSGIGSLEADLGLVGDQYNWALSIFFVGYVIFEVPSNLMLKRVRPSRWLARIMVSWGLFAALLAASVNFASIMIFRLLLGIMEAGLFPGILFYLSFWFRKHEYARRMSWFFSAASAAGAFGGLLAFGIARLDGVGNLAGWRWVFLIEGLPTILFGVATWWVLPDFPSTAKFLSERQRKIANERLRRENVDPDEVDFSWQQFTTTVSDVKVWIWMLLYLSQLIPLYSFSFFLPSIVRGLNFSSLNAQAMSSPPFLMACIASVASGFSSDYFKDRSSHVIAGLALGSISFWLLAFIRNTAAQYALTILCAMGIYPSVPPILSWVSNNVTGSTGAGVALAMVVGFGNIGGAIAGQVYKSSDAVNFYQTGHIVNGSLTIVGICLTIAQRMYLVHLNKKREEGEKLVAEEENGDGGFVTVNNPRFRWQL